jgi:hypothetical protein
MADYESIACRRLRILVSVFADFWIFLRKAVTGARRAPSYEYEGGTLGAVPH